MRGTADLCHRNNHATLSFAAHRRGMTSHAKHPDRLAAEAAGHIRWHGPDCLQHSPAERWTSNGRCVDCSRESTRETKRCQSAARQPYRVTRRLAIEARRAEAVAKRAAPNITDHPVRLAALAAGDRFFEGPSCRHGHAGLRYTASTACVACRTKKAAA